MIGKTFLIAAFTAFCFAGSAQASEVTIQPIDEPVTIQPIDEPVTIQPIEEEMPPADRPVTIQPIEDTSPPVGPRIIDLYLWISRDGKMVKRRLIPCRPGCAEARILLRVSAISEGPFCQGRYFGPLRAGGFYGGKRLGVFSKANFCQRAKWRKVAAIYNRYF